MKEKRYVNNFEEFLNKTKASNSLYNKKEKETFVNVFLVFKFFFKRCTKTANFVLI
jgi:hypothetical protein